MRYRKTLAAALLGGLVLAAGLYAQDDAPAKRKQVGGFRLPDLASGLKATEGCLGVELAQTNSKKLCIFAWFENKKAVLRWFYSDAHEGVMKQFFTDGRPQTKPLEHIAHDSGPIMVIASLTMAKRPHFEAVKMPISQIAIELYRPLPGGIYFGSRFTPDAVKVPHSRDYTKKKTPATDK